MLPDKPDKPDKLGKTFRNHAENGGIKLSKSPSGALTHPTTAQHDPLVDVIRGCTSIELAAWLWDLTRMLGEATEPGDLGFLRYRRNLVRREIGLRERMSDPVAPLRAQSARYDLERIKDDLPLTEVAPHLAAVQLVRRGRHFVGRCPFPDHRDGTPSFTVSADGRLWRCHGCGKGGDLFTFAEHWFGARSFIAAVEIVVTGMGRRLDAYRVGGSPGPERRYVA